MAKYIFEAGLSLDPASIDFTVRGKTNSKKPNIVRQAQQRVIKPPKEKKEKLEKPKVKKSIKIKTPERKSPQKLVKSPKKTLTQKLVIKMNFSTPTKRNKTEEGTKAPSSDSKLTKGIKRKLEKIKYPAAKKTKVIVNGKAKAVKSKPSTSKTNTEKEVKSEKKGKAEVKIKAEEKMKTEEKAKVKKKPVKEAKAEPESESEDNEEESEELEEEDEVSESEQETDSEAESVSESEAETVNGGVSMNQVDASDYRYSLEEIDLNQVKSDDSDDDDDDDDDENDVDVENYESENPLGDQLESSGIEESEGNEDYEMEAESEEEETEVENKENLSILERLGNEAVEFKKYGNSEKYISSQQKVVVLSNPEVLSNPNIIIGEYGDTDDEIVQETVDTENYVQESEEDVENNINAMADSTDNEKVERLLNVTEGMTVQDAYEASVRLGHFSDLPAASVSQRRSSRGSPSKYGSSARRSSYEKTKLLSDTVEWDTKRTRRTWSEDNNKVVSDNNNSMNTFQVVQKETEQTKILDSNLLNRNSVTVNSKPAESVALSPRLSKRLSSESVSNETSRRRKSSEIAKSPARSPRSRTVSEPSSRLKTSPVKENAEDENRYHGPDGKIQYMQTWDKL